MAVTRLRGAAGLIDSETVEHSGAQGYKARDRRLLWAAVLVLAAATFALFSQNLTTNFVGDDWFFLAFAHDHGLSGVLTPEGGYHYNPLLSLIVFAMYHGFGLNPVPYHVLAYACFWLGSVLVMLLGWRLSGRQGIGILAGLLFVAFGTQYEAAIWGVVAFWPSVSTVVYLAGLLLFITARDQALARARQRAAYGGFLIALVLGPFFYEQDISLIGACMLYRLLVLEAHEPFRLRAVAGRWRAWLGDFAVPGMYFLAYLGLKVWLGRQTPIPQLPGLSEGWNGIAFAAGVGFLQAFLPGMTVRFLEFAALDYLSPRLYLLVLLVELFLILLPVIELLVLGFLFAKVKPVPRFLLALAVMLVVTQSLALGNISSRHLFLITAPTAILWAALTAEISRRVAAWLSASMHPVRGARWLAHVPSAALVVLFVFAGVRYSLQAQGYWRAAVGHVDQLMAQVRKYAAADPSATTLYLVNVPDYVAAPTGETMYEFRNSPQGLVTLTMPNRFRSVVAVRTDNTFPINWGYTVFANENTLLKWSRSPGSLMLQYDVTSGIFRPWASQQH